MRWVHLLLLASLCCLSHTSSAGVIQVPSAAESAQPGTVLWSVDVGDQIWSPLRVSDRILYFGCDDGYAYAYDPGRRGFLWKFDTGARVRSAVVVTDGQALFSSDKGVLYALDASTGRSQWQCVIDSTNGKRSLPAPTPPYDYDMMQASPVVSGGVVFVGSADGNLYAVDQQNGVEQWRFKTKGRIRATPVVDGEIVYFGSWDGNLYAVDSKTGSLIWKFDTGGVIQGAVASAEGKIVVGSRSARIQVIDALTGELEWEYTDPMGSWIESSPVIENGTLFIGSSDALKVFAFDLQTGRMVWSSRTHGWSWGSPMVSGGVVYIGAIAASPYPQKLTAGFLAFDQESGKLEWDLPTQAIDGFVTGGVFSQAAAIDEVVYVAALDGRIYALQK